MVVSKHKQKFFKKENKTNRKMEINKNGALCKEGNGEEPKDNFVSLQT